MIIFKSHQAIDLIKSYLSAKPTIIEAGAFDGTDTIRLAKQWPNGIIHAFEPVPELYARLLENTKNYPNIHCYNLALSNQNGIASFYISEKPEKPGKSSQAGSLLPPKERLKHSPLQFPRTIQVPTITLDTWAQKHANASIDCAWLDIQGYELAVLQAAPKMIKSLQVIYLEVSFIEGYEGQPTYANVKQWLKQHGFTEIGRNFTNTTDWFFGNCLFARQ